MYLPGTLRLSIKQKPEVREAAGAPTESLLRKRTISTIVVAQDDAGRLAEHVERDGAAAREVEAVPREAPADEAGTAEEE